MAFCCRFELEMFPRWLKLDFVGYFPRLLFYNLYLSRILLKLHCRVLFLLNHVSTNNKQVLQVNALMLFSNLPNKNDKDGKDSEIHTIPAHSLETAK